jgi:hypothetical protein
VEVGVEQAGDDVAAGRVEHLAAAVAARRDDRGDAAVADQDVGLLDLLGEDVDDPAAAHDQVGGLAAERGVHQADEHAGVTHRELLRARPGRTGPG